MYDLNYREFKNKLREAYNKNKEAAKHEGDRYLKSVDEVIKDNKAILEDMDNKPEAQPEPLKEPVQQEKPSNNTEKANYIANEVNETANRQEVHDYAYLVAWSSLYGFDSLTEEGRKEYYKDQSMINHYMDFLSYKADTVYGAGAGNEACLAVNAKVQELIDLYYTQLVAEWNEQERLQQQEIINQQNLLNQQMMNQMMFGF